MPLVLTLRESPAIPLEVDGILPTGVAGMSTGEVRRLRVHQGNRTVALGDCFEVEGVTDDDTHVWRGDCSRVKSIGAGLERGSIVVEGDAGLHVGAQMSGGRLDVHGNVDDWAGAELRGGLLHVHGRAGNLVGAAYRGGRRGMTGGTILVDGDAGHEIGHTMRRGVIAIGGRTGDAIGFNMIAGTVLAGGETGIRHGAGMRRGSLVFTGDTPPLLPTFESAGRQRFVYLRFYLLRLRELGFNVPREWLDADYARHDGDFLALGRGEILTRVA